MDNYATHLPILKALPSQYIIRKVLEFGAGSFSTPIFLDKHIYSDVEKVISYEDDMGWYTALKDPSNYGDSLPFHFDDERLGLFYVKRPMHESLIPFFNTLYMDKFDLIFIDNGSTIAERVQLIESVVAVQPKGLVVIHDFEHREYQQSTKGWPVRTIYTGFEPHTAILMSPRCVHLPKVVR